MWLVRAIKMPVYAPAGDFRDHALFRNSSSLRGMLSVFWYRRKLRWVEDLLLLWNRLSSSTHGTGTPLVLWFLHKISGKNEQPNQYQNSSQTDEELVFIRPRSTTRYNLKCRVEQSESAEWIRYLIRPSFDENIGYLVHAAVYWLNFLRSDVFALWKFENVFLAVNNEQCPSLEIEYRINLSFCLSFEWKKRISNSMEGGSIQATETAI